MQVKTMRNSGLMSITGKYKVILFYLMLTLNIILDDSNHFKSRLILTFRSSFISPKQLMFEASNFVQC